MSADEFRFACYDLGHYLTEEQLSLALHKIDQNNDGAISYNEWLQWWRSNNRFGALQLSEEGVLIVFPLLIAIIRKNFAETKPSSCFSSVFPELQLLAEAVKYYRFFDKDNSGSLTIDEFKELYNDLIKGGYGAHLGEGGVHEALKLMV